MHVGMNFVARISLLSLLVMYFLTVLSESQIRVTPKRFQSHLFYSHHGSTRFFFPIQKPHNHVVNCFQAVHVHATCFLGVTSYRTQFWTNWLLRKKIDIIFQFLVKYPDIFSHRNIQKLCLFFFSTRFA